MAEQWFAVVDGDGQCVSVGTEVTDSLPNGWQCVTLSDADAAIVRERPWRWENGRVVEVPPPVPSDVEPWRLALWLLRRHGVRPSQVEAQFDAIPDEVQREEARISWRMQRPIPRAAAIVAQIGASLGLSEAELDDGYREASQYE